MNCEQMRLANEQFTPEYCGVPCRPSFSHMRAGFFVNAEL